MLENPTPSASPADPAATVKRYAPPNQRNRSLNRRKSGDRVDRTNSLNSNDGEKNQLAASRIVPVMDHGDAGRSNHLNENARPGLIALEGCSSTSSDASQFLYDRWQAAMHCYNNPSIDLSERPVMYSGSGASAWGHFRLSHQLMSPTASVGPSSGLQMDFLGELRRAMRNANASSDP